MKIELIKSNLTDGCCILVNNEKYNKLSSDEIKRLFYMIGDYLSNL